MQPDFLFFGFRSLLASFLHVVFPKKKKSSRASEIALNLFINCRHSKNSCRFKLAWGLFFQKFAYSTFVYTGFSHRPKLLSCHFKLSLICFYVWIRVCVDVCVSLMGCTVGSVQCLLLSEGFLINLKPFLFCDVVKFIEQNLTSDFIGSLRVRIILHVSWYWWLRRLVS